MKRRQFLKALGLSAGLIATGNVANASDNPFPNPLETITGGIESIGEGVISIFQETLVDDIYVLGRDGKIRKEENEPASGLKLKIYGIDGGFIPPVKTYFTRNQVGYAITYNDKSLIIDAGSNVILKDKKTLGEAEAIILSHIHIDHILHLKRIRDVVGSRATIYSPSYFPLMKNVETDIPEKIGPFNIEHDLTMHSIKNYAYKFNVRGRVICYTGDANYTEGLAEFCKGADILLTELTLGDKNVDFIDSHMSPREVIKLAKKAKPRLLVPTHFKYITPTQAEEIISKEFPNVISARPGATFVIE